MPSKRERVQVWPVLVSPRMRISHPLQLYLALAGLSAGALGLAIVTGSAELSGGELLAALAGGGDSLARTVVWDLRLPRALAGFATGGLLALAGCLMQVLLRNPLADPYVLGVSGGAAVGALTLMLLGFGSLLIQLGAFGGALTVTALVFALGRGDGSWSATRMLLTGIVLAAGCGAVISILLALGPDSSLRGMLFWLIGDLAYAPPPGRALATLALGLAAAMLMARNLNALAGGDAQATLVGVDTRRLRPAVYALASLLTAVAVTTAGSVGFVGLVVPHAMRLLLGANQRRLLPAATIVGGCLLVIADTVARTIAAPRQLPVGALTAILGVPVFLYLLGRGDPRMR